MIELQKNVQYNIYNIINIVETEQQVRDTKHNTHSQSEQIIGMEEIKVEIHSASHQHTRV
ncbi:MAG: hypothetical protein PV340_03760 [Wolbachia sp.]|nr:hypothetical protein [Wolbachia sp.]